MNLLVVELYPEKGHFRLFDNIVRLLATRHNITAIYPGSTTPANSMANVIVANYDYYSRRYQNRLLNVIDYIKYCNVVCRYVHGEELKHAYDAIVVVTYSEVAFAVGKKYFSNLNKVILMNHNNLDLICNSAIKKKLFRMYSHDVKHIVQCSFIGNQLENAFKIPAQRIAKWKHPLNSNSTVASQNELIYDCVGLSNSNDESIIEAIVEKEKETNFIKESGLRVILKTKGEPFDNGALTTINGFIASSEYNEYNNKSRCIFLPFPLDFKFRMSGTLVDAFSNRKAIIGSNIPLFRACKDRYPDLVCIYEPNQLVEQIIKVCHKNVDIQIEEFLNNHSDDMVAINMETELDRILNNGSIVTEIDF